MRKITIPYWIFTGLLAALMLFSGISYFVDPESANALINTHLGYPIYFAPLISALKIPGVIILLLPGLPRLKEWVYAAFTFDLGMALYSFIAVGDPIASVWFIAFALVLLFGSYIFYHKRLKAQRSDDSRQATPGKSGISLGTSKTSG